MHLLRRVPTRNTHLLCKKRWKSRSKSLVRTVRREFGLQAISASDIAIGDGIAIPVSSPHPWAVIVPLTLPGERVRTRIYRNHRLHSFGDLLEVVTPNTTLRDNSRVQCKYFGQCGGCQYQMLSYEQQLDFKREVVVKAYRNYCQVLEGQMPTIRPTAPSPLQYGYRTKLTPHFEGPPKKVQKGPRQPTTEQPDWLTIGFNKIGTRKVMDIEECPIATSTINNQIKPVRQQIIECVFPPRTSYPC